MSQISFGSLRKKLYIRVMVQSFTKILLIQTPVIPHLIDQAGRSVSILIRGLSEACKIETEPNNKKNKNDFSFIVY